MTLHVWCGYSILTLLVFRLVWGFTGSSTARFQDFVRGPAAIVGYGRRLFSPGGSFVAGHNPMGALMVVAFLAVLLTQATTGLFARDVDDYFGVAQGPLIKLVSTKISASLTSLHKLNFALLEILILAHVLANILYWVVRHENLIGAMFTGRKVLKPGQTAPDIAFASGWRALAILIAVAVFSWLAIVTLSP